MENMIKNGEQHIGRLLHYFPYDVKENGYDVKKNLQADWCGWHNDHGALTALTSAMYLDSHGKPIEFK